MEVTSFRLPARSAALQARQHLLAERLLAGLGVADLGLLLGPQILQRPLLQLALQLSQAIAGLLVGRHPPGQLDEQRIGRALDLVDVRASPRRLAAHRACRSSPTAASAAADSHLPAAGEPPPPGPVLPGYAHPLANSWPSPSSPTRAVATEATRLSPHPTHRWRRRQHLRNTDHRHVQLQLRHVNPADLRARLHHVPLRPLLVARPQVPATIRVS